MPFGELVCGPPGSGKSTYCYGKHQLFTSLSRPIAIVNLDPAATNNENTLPYPCDIDIADLVSLDEVMREQGLGPNGGMVFCIEYLEANFDWLEGRLRDIVLFENGEEGGGGGGGEKYVLFDLPGQVEISTNLESMKRIVEKLTKLGFRLATIHLCDSHYITSSSTYISLILLSLRSMLHLHLPHINVLSKIDLLNTYANDLHFNLDFYTQVQDLSYLSHTLSSSTLPPKFAALNMSIISLIEDYSLVSFETLAVEDKSSMLNLTRTIDRATGYIFVPPPSPSPSQQQPSTLRPNAYSLFSSASRQIPGPQTDIRDVQERWLDAREEWDAFEKRSWRNEQSSS